MTEELRRARTLAQIADDIRRRRLRTARDELRSLLGRVDEPLLRASLGFQLGSLCWGEIGDGVESRRLFHEAAELLATTWSLTLSPDTQTLAANCCENAMLLSLSYDEFEMWATRLEALQPANAILSILRPRIREQQEAGHAWSRIVLEMSRAYTAADRADSTGRHACGAATLHLVLANRRELRVPRAEWRLATIAYAAAKVMTVMRILDATPPPDAASAREVAVVLEDALPLVRAYTRTYPRDHAGREAYDALAETSAAIRPRLLLGVLRHKRPPSRRRAPPKRPTATIPAWRSSPSLARALRACGLSGSEFDLTTARLVDGSAVELCFARRSPGGGSRAADVALALEAVVRLSLPQLLQAEGIECAFRSGDTVHLGPGVAVPELAITVAGAAVPLIVTGATDAHDWRLRVGPGRSVNGASTSGADVLARTAAALLRLTPSPLVLRG